MTMQAIILANIVVLYGGLNCVAVNCEERLLTA